MSRSRTTLPTEDRAMGVLVGVATAVALILWVLMSIKSEYLRDMRLREERRKRREELRGSNK